MLQPNPVPAVRYDQRFRTSARQRTIAIGLAVLLEALLLLLLFSLGSDRTGDEEGDLTVVQFKARDFAEEAPAPDLPEPEEPAQDLAHPPNPPDEVAPPPRPLAPETPPMAEPAVTPAPRALIPTPREQPSADVYPRPIQALRPGRSVAGPPNRAGAASGDTARVGTAPNGEPLYAAAWYREPADDELRGYLSTARGPGWGLVACRTAPDYRVEDCVALAEFPQGSQINRAVLAAAWQFKVRPPRLGGRPQIGSWVRIRIDYEVLR